MKEKYKRKTNLVNNTGYTPGYSTEKNPYNIIPSENITMANTPYPLHATPLDQNGNPIGNPVIMRPGGEYNFKGASYVKETKLFQNGGENMFITSGNQPLIIPPQGSYPLSYRDRGNTDVDGTLFSASKKVSRVDEMGRPLTRNQVAENQTMWNAQKQAYGPAQQAFNNWKNNEANTNQGYFIPSEYETMVRELNSRPDVGQEGLNDATFTSTKCGISKQHAKEDKKEFAKKEEGGFFKTKQDNMNNRTTLNFAKGGTKQSWISEKISKLMHEGHPQQQAIAIAYSMYDQHHANGGYQLPEYQIGDKFGKTNNQVGFVQGFGNPDYSANPKGEPKPDYNKDYMSMSTEDEKLTPPIDYNKEYMNMSTADENLKQPEDESKKAREDFEGNTMYQFYNPYGGYGMGESLFNAGRAAKKGDTFGLTANLANVGLEAGKGFFGGMGLGNVEQQQKNTYYQKQREAMTGQNTATAMKRGGRFRMPKYQEGDTFDINNPYGENESMNKYINSERQKNEILLRKEPIITTVEEAPAGYVEPAEEQTSNFDSKSARDTWVHKTGMPWSKAKELGYTTGTAKDNMKLLSELNDSRFRKENLRSEAPKRKTANRKAIDLKPKVNLPEQNNYYDLPQNSPVTAKPGYIDPYKGWKRDSEGDLRNAKGTMVGLDGKPLNWFERNFGSVGSPPPLDENGRRMKQLGPNPTITERNAYNEAAYKNKLQEQAQLKKAQQLKQEQLDKTWGKPQNNLYSFYQEGGEQGEIQQGGGQEEQVQQIMQQISETLQQGADPQQILQQLVQMGIPQEQAQQMIQMAMQQVQGGQQQAPQGTPQLKCGGSKYQEGGEAMDEQMEGENEGAEGETPSMEQIESQVEQALEQGADPQQVLQQLIQMGMPEQQAVQMIQEILQEIQGGETEMEAPEQGNPQMRAGGKYLEILKGKTIKSYNLNKKTGNYEVVYS